MKQVSFNEWCEFLIERKVYFTESKDENCDSVMFAHLSKGKSKDKEIAKSCYHFDGRIEYFIGGMVPWTKI